MKKVINLKGIIMKKHILVILAISTLGFILGCSRPNDPTVPEDQNSQKEDIKTDLPNEQDPQTNDTTSTSSENQQPQGNDTISQPANKELPKSVGLWKTGFPFKSITGYDILFDVTIASTPDVFTLASLNKDTKDTILAQSGDWKLNDAQDSIIFYGTDCRIIDTTLNQLVERNCQSFIVPLTISGNEWKVPMEGLLPLAEQMNITIPAEAMGMLRAITVVLKKQD